jgi:thioredoxin-like negative regulator of GroEL
MDPEEYRKQLERNILAIIEEKLQKGQMDTERAKAIARMVLDSLHPPLTLEQIYQIAPTFDDHFKELAVAVLPVIQEHEEKIRTIVTEYAQKLIKEGKIDEATKILKQATQGESKASI